MSPPQVAPKFIPLSSHALLYTPDTLQAAQNFPDDELIIFCPWLGATPRHMAKYALLLIHLAPKARILLLPSSLSTLFSPEFVVQWAMKPAVTVVRNVLDDASRKQSGSKSARIFVYCFSNGGCFSILRLLRALRATRGEPLAIGSIMLDSCPGQASYGAGVKAMELAMPRAGPLRFIRWPAMAIVRLAFAVLSVLMKLGWQHPIQKMRVDMFNQDLVVGKKARASSETAEHTSVRARYVFSRADALIQWRDIRHHAQAATAHGWSVDEALFEDSAHCAHYLKDPDRYERLLREMWEASDVGI